MPEPIEPDKFMLPAKIYDNLKLISTVLIPAFSTLYFALGGVWNLPGVTQVIGTCAALITFIGFILSRASRNFQNATGSGFVTVVPGEDGKSALSLDLDTLPPNIENMKAILLKVQK